MQELQLPTAGLSTQACAAAGQVWSWWQLVGWLSQASHRAFPPPSQDRLGGLEHPSIYFFFSGTPSFPHILIQTLLAVAMVLRTY